MDVGEWGALVQGVADPDVERDDGVGPAGRVDEVKEIELLDDPRAAVPDDGSTKRLGRGECGSVAPSWSVARNG